MVKLNQAMEYFLKTRFADLWHRIAGGESQLLTLEVRQEYAEWLKTDQAKQYLPGGAKYIPHRSPILR